MRSVAARLFLVACACLVAAGAPARAQQPAASRTAGSPASGLPASDLPASDSSRAAETGDWLVLPFAAYAPQTKLEGGLIAGYYWSTGPGVPGSEVSGLVSVTQRRQVVVQVAPEVYLQGGRLRLVGEVEASEYPNSFYGIGGDTPRSVEETYTSRYARADLSLQRTAAPDLRVGPRVVARLESDPTVDGSCRPPAGPGERLACGAVAGADGGFTAGVGVRATRDRRGNRYYPRSGSYADASVLWHSALWGSRTTFARATADLRGYRPVGPAVAAVGAYAEAVAGTAPFTMLPQLGGPDRLRGYRLGRHRDDVYWAAQAALRAPLFWRFKAVAFAGAGEAAGAVGPDLVRGINAAVGLGGRLRLNDAGVHGRLDLAYGADGLQVYISLGEAF
jgi:hypothetical protein